MINENDTVTQTRNRQRFYAFCGIIAPILFWVMVIVESLLRPGYSQFYNFVSDLGVGPLAIIQNINFVVFGLLSFGLALGLRGGLPSSQGRALNWCMVRYNIQSWCIVSWSISRKFSLTRSA